MKKSSQLWGKSKRNKWHDDIIYTNLIFGGLTLTLDFYIYMRRWIMMVVGGDVWSIASMDEQSDLPTFAVSLLFIHLFHLFIRSFIYSIIYPFIHLLLYWMVHLLTLTSKFHQHISIFILIHSSIHPFISSHNG